MSGVKNFIFRVLKIVLWVKDLIISFDFGDIKG